ncbi:sodium:solute symporter family transporter [Cognatilysobacter terrigena]|uniref:sodium:solute symporter family transporter n=1 Tax=Cognatilysobacter terrigena TaxID=2488749 RepID=UPI00105F81FF|nr:sodium/solute symporter [Lysobacter terrigena]
MSSNAVQVAVFLALTALVALATWWRCRRERHTTDRGRDYFLAGGSLTWPFIAGSLLLTNISAEQIVGMNGAQTMLMAWWEFGAAAGLLVLAHVLVPMYYRYKCTTTTELLERRLGDPGLRRAVSVMFLLGYLFILLPMVLYTGSKFMASMFHPDLPIIAIAALFAIGGLAYAAIGGLRAIAISDTYMGVVLLVMGVLVTVFALNAVHWDLSSVPVERLTLIGSADSDIPWQTLFTGMLFAHLFYWGTNMVIAQRALAAPTVREAQKGIYAAAFFKMLTPAIVVLPGILAFKLFGDVDDDAYGRLVGLVLPSWLSGAFAAAITGAVLSSYSAALNSAAALYTVDVHLVKINPSADPKRLGRIVTIAFTVLSLAIVPLYTQSKSIMGTLQQLNGLYSMPVLAAFIVAIFFNGVNAKAVRWALVFGTTLYGFFTFGWPALTARHMLPQPPHYIHLMFVTLLATIAFALVGSRAMGGARRQAIPDAA